MPAPTRLFDVVFGNEGEDQTVVHTGEPSYKARRLAMALLKTEQLKCEDGGHEQLAATFATLFEMFRDAPGGDILFGYVKKWIGLDGRRKFLGVIETGTDYRDAGFKPSPADPNRRTGVTHFGPAQVARKPFEQKVKHVDPAAQIADKMARAASAAVRED
jgi:hypothetical protein